MKHKYISIGLIFLTSCSTMTKSVRFGGAAGATGGAAISLATNNDRSLETIGISSLVGLGLGVLTSYFTHKHINKKPEKREEKRNIHFGNLPKNPFEN